MKRIFIFLAIISNTTASMAQATKDFQWPDKYRSAVVLTYDDGRDCHLDVAIPALDAHGFKGTFYCPGNSISLQNRMDEWRSIAENGHELGNHTLFHPCDAMKQDWVKDEYDLNNYTLDQIRNELFTANTLLMAVDGKKERTFGYTCSDYLSGGISFIDDVRKMFVAARSDGPVPESMADVDIHFVPSWGVDSPSGKELIDFVKLAQEKGTIAVFMFHNVGGGYLNVSSEAHNELLDYLELHRDDIWTDTFLNVMKYVAESR